MWGNLAKVLRIDNSQVFLCVRSEGDSVASYTVSRIMGEDSIKDLILFLTSCTLSLIFNKKTRQYNEISTKTKWEILSK